MRARSRVAGPRIGDRRHAGAMAERGGVTWDAERADESDGHYACDSSASHWAAPVAKASERLKSRRRNRAPEAQPADGALGARPRPQVNFPSHGCTCSQRGSADFLQDNRVIFDIRGKAYRLIAQIKYGPLFVVYIRSIGTHAEYDRIDAATV